MPFKKIVASPASHGHVSASNMRFHRFKVFIRLLQGFQIKSPQASPVRMNRPLLTNTGT